MAAAESSVAATLTNEGGDILVAEVFEKAQVQHFAVLGREGVEAAAQILGGGWLVRCLHRSFEVPEPGGALLVCSGLALLGLARRRRNRAGLRGISRKNRVQSCPS